MSFQPHVHQKIVISNVVYKFLPNPVVPRIPFGQEAGKATVYKIAKDGGGEYALKVFRHKFKDKHILVKTQALSNYKALNGLHVCNRLAITPENNADLIKEHPDLAYCIVMPWVSATTWFEIMRKEELTFEQSLLLARSFAGMMAGLEKERVAHCDISSGNVLFYRSPVDVALVDVEDIYSPKLTKPDFPPAGSPGYAHHTAPKGLWSAEADRFAAAILLAEILGWCDGRVRRAKYGEQFFDPAEMPHKDRRQPTSQRFNLLHEVLFDRWGNGVSKVFSEAWYSESLEACPSLTEWSHIIGRVSKPISKWPTPIQLDTDVGVATAQRASPAAQAPPPTANGPTWPRQPQITRWPTPVQLDTDLTGSVPRPTPPPQPAPPVSSPAPLPQLQPPALTRTSSSLNVLWRIVIAVIVIVLFLIFVAANS